jgi:mRNA-degrading endonuclease RelE of RelBE toxin-antitoxin system
MDILDDLIRKGLIIEKKLTEDEFNAVYEWVTAEKDSFEEPFKSGILKLVGNEEKRRVRVNK